MQGAFHGEYSIPQKNNKAFAAVLKEIWLAPSAEAARKRANEDSDIRLVTTYLMEYAEDWSVSRAYLSKESIAATLQIAA